MHVHFSKQFKLELRPGFLVQIKFLLILFKTVENATEMKKFEKLKRTSAP